ncbi:MAG: response regulator [Candidatus Riflebacteria bacterium]|nr:response regulator [Candidatus Riflebacteria bacterium]
MGGYTEDIPGELCEGVGIPADSTPGRILIVDDDEDCLSTVAMILGKHGFRPATAPNREAALSLLSRLPVELVILDLYMPDVFGMTLLREAKRIRPRLKAIILTAGGDWDTYMDALDDGVQAYLTKPLAQGEFLKEVRQALNKRSSVE